MMTWQEQQVLSTQHTWRLRLQACNNKLKNMPAQNRQLTQPAARALADPTTLVLNMEVHQNWQATKVAREKPMNRRETMKPAALVHRPMQYTAGAVRPMHSPMPKRGPLTSAATRWWQRWESGRGV